MARAIAFYLPQFYPTPENDQWWGKGFTEWTNVGRAQSLFPGHYQPRVPADLGYYDLRMPDVRIQQASMAQQAGIEGFCYWHYWFAGDRLLDRVFSEVVESNVPDFPFCLCWANHSWKAKTWDPAIPDRMLKEQTYPGEADYEMHFYTMLPAFKDNRYIKYKGQLLFGIFDPRGIPDMVNMSHIWNRLAKKNGLPGFCFFSFAQGIENLSFAQKEGFDIVVYDAMFDSVYSYQNLGISSRLRAKMNSLLKRPNPIEYDYYARTAIRNFEQYPNTIPCIDPNFDHSPRSGVKGTILHNSTPKKWGEFCKKTADLVDKQDKDGLLFIKSWNEWGEGNYLEPDLRFGDNYLKETKRALCSDEQR